MTSFETKTELKNFALFARLGGNSKTDKGVMISILPKTGLDLENVRSKGSSSCGDCPHSKAQAGKKHGSCYVYKRPGGSQGALGGIQNGFSRCENVSLVKFVQQVTVLAELTGFIRVGEFGDPAADMQTADIIAAILVGIDPTVTRACYTHQWNKKKAKNLKGLCMASCDTSEQTKKALELGWSVFEVVPRKADIQAVHCPAQATKGLVNCNTCGKCTGSTVKHVQINLH
jgi:hypothetical protein